jgi:hypothetical protein
MTDSSIPNKSPPHLEDQARGYNGEQNDPMFGFVPRTVTAKQVEAVLVSDQPVG